MFRSITRALESARMAHPIVTARLGTLPRRIQPRPQQRTLSTTPPRQAFGNFSGGRRPSYSRFGGKSGSSKITERLGELMTQRVVIAILVGGGAYYIYHLEKIPESGRWRFIDVSKEAERKVGMETYNEIMQQYKHAILPSRHPTSLFVQDVAERILTSTGLGHLKGHSQSPPAPFGGADIFNPDESMASSQEEWEVYVIKEDTPNAFVLPGGKIFVFTGILPICKGPDGLASVLGHEIAHQVARHGGERMSSTKILFAIGLLLDILGLDFGVSRLATTILLTLPNSRTQEAEADTIGLRLMSQACFDPQEASHMWTRMSELEAAGESKGFLASILGGGGATGVDFLSTHPATGKRIKAIEKQLPEAFAVRAGSSACAHELGGQYSDFKDRMTTSFGRFGGFGSS